MRPPFLSCLAMLAALSIAATVQAQTVSLHRSGEQVTILVGEAATLPQDFPGDVFVPPTATLVRVETLGQDQLLLEFTSAEDPEALATAYADAMSADGWSPATVAPVAGARVRAWEKDERAVLLATVAEAGTTRLRLQLLPRTRPAARPAPTP